MKTFDAVTLETIGMQDAPLIPLSLARRIMLHWVVRLLITWFGFGLLTWASIAGLEALSVEIGPIISVGVLAVCALLAVFAVTRLIEQRNPAEIGLDLRRSVMDWLKGAGVGAAYLCASVGILACRAPVVHVPAGTFSRPDPCRTPSVGSVYDPPTARIRP